MESYNYKCDVRKKMFKEEETKHVNVVFHVYASLLPILLAYIITDKR